MQHTKQQYSTQIVLTLLGVLTCLMLTARVGTAQNKDSANFKNLLGDQKTDDSPLYVKSDSLRLDAKSRIFIYEKNVEIVRGDVRITCDSMKGTYGEDSRLKTILCRDNVVITRGEEMRANANRALYEVEKSTIILTEGPELARDGNLLSADTITIFVDEDRSEAAGNVRVKVLKAESSASSSAPVAAASEEEL